MMHSEVDGKGKEVAKKGKGGNRSIRPEHELCALVGGIRKVIPFEAHASCQKLRETTLASYPKSYVFALRRRGTFLGLLCNSDFPSVWLRKIMRGTEVYLQFEPPQHRAHDDQNGIEELRMPEGEEEQTLKLLMRYLHRRGKRFDCLDISSASISGLRWCILLKERLFFLPPHEAATRCIRYAPLNSNTSCNIVSENAFQICVQSTKSLYDPIKITARSHDDVVAWVEAISNRDSVVSENKLFETAEQQISAAECAYSEHNLESLHRLDTLEGVLRNRFMRARFQTFLKRDSHNEKNMLRFWIECERYRTTHPDSDSSWHLRSSASNDTTSDAGTDGQTSERIDYRYDSRASSSDSILPDVVQLKRSRIRRTDAPYLLHSVPTKSETLVRNDRAATNPRAGGRGREVQRPPQWIPDSHTDRCMWPGCSLVFRSFREKVLGTSRSRSRHHCRGCGGLFCDQHCSKFLPLPFFGLRNPVRVCDECWTFFFEPPSQRRSISSSGSDLSSRRTRSSKASELGFVSARAMSVNYARRIYRNFIAKDSPLAVPCDGNEEKKENARRTEIRARLREAPRDIFVRLQMSIFNRLRESKFKEFRMLKNFRHLQKCALRAPLDAVASGLSSARASTHHLKRQYGSFTIGTWSDRVGTEQHKTTGDVAADVAKQFEGKSPTRRGRRRSRPRNRGVVALSGALEEWEKPHAWMNLESSAVLLAPSTLVSDGVLTAVVDDPGPVPVASSAPPHRTKTPEPCVEVSSTKSSHRLTKSADGSSYGSKISSSTSSRNVLLRSSVGVWLTPPLRPASFGSSAGSDRKSSCRAKREVFKIAENELRTTPDPDTKDVSPSLRSNSASAPVILTSPADTKEDTVMTGWLSCRLVAPWTVVVPGVAISNAMSSRNVRKDSAVSMHFYVLSENGDLKRFLDERMEELCDHFVNVGKEVIEVAVAKESGAPEQSFEIVTRKGIFIMQPDLPFTTCSEWIFAIRKLLGSDSAVACTGLNDVKSRVLLDGHLWKRSNGTFGLYSPHMRRRRFRLLMKKENKTGFEMLFLECYDGYGRSKSVVRLDRILDVFCRAPTRSEKNDGIVDVTTVDSEDDGTERRISLRYFFELVTPQRRWVFCTEDPESLRKWYIELRRYKARF